MNKFFNNKGQLASIEEKWLDGVIIKQDIKGNSIIDCNCSRCGGAGKLDQFYHVENGTCFKCNGSGREEKSMKLYSQEKAEILALRYKNRQENKYQEYLKNKEIEFINYIKKDLNIENELYIVTENNSFEIKEDLKREGFKYKNFGWYSNKDSEKYKTVCITLDEIIDIENMNYNKIYSLINDYKKLNNKSSYIGSVKDKISLNVTLEYCNIYDGYAYDTNTYYYNFKDENGNRIQWKTSKSLDITNGSKLNLKGTIKELKEDKEYNKITVVTRCKIA